MEDASCTIQPEAASAAANKRRQEPFPSHDAPSLGQIGREESIPFRVFPRLNYAKKVGERKSTRENRAIRRHSLPETSNSSAKTLKHIFKIRSNICKGSLMAIGERDSSNHFQRSGTSRAHAFFCIRGPPASRCCISASTRMNACTHCSAYFLHPRCPPAAAAENRRL